MVENVASSTYPFLSFEKWKLLLKESTPRLGVRHSNYTTALTQNQNSELWALEPKYCVNPRAITHDQDLKNDQMDMHSVMEKSNSQSELAADLDLVLKNQSLDNYLSVLKHDISPTSRFSIPLREESIALKSEISQLNHTFLPKEESIIVKSESPLLRHSCVKEEIPSTSVSPILTAELEDFQDISPWCRDRHATKMSSDTIDELNTPNVLFEEFEYLIPTPTPADQSSCYVSVNPSDSDVFNGVDIPLNDHEFHDLTSHVFGDVSNHNSISQTDNYFNNIGGGDKQIAYKQITTNDNISTVTYELNASPGLGSDGDGVLTFATSSNFQLELPSKSTMDLQDIDISNLNTINSPVTFTPNLKLDFTKIWPDNSKIISTPEVINTALSMDKSFSLIDFIDDEKEATVSDVHTETKSSGSPSVIVELDVEDPSYSPSEASDNDEDYEPPWKKTKQLLKFPRRSRKGKGKGARFETDSDLSNASTVDSTKVVRRGRPPKVTTSFSSDNTTDEVSRYRELRNKNNEASRRSRLNRKLKEMQMAEEAKELEERNQRLKVQVSEMERLVDTMRSNLMTLLLKK